jgi:YD repeat-containing protein
LTEVEGFTVNQGITYDANGALKTLTFANGVTASYNYDNLNRLEDYQVTLSGADILQQHFTYDKSHNITAVTEGTKTKTYDYDANNQLTRSITPGEFVEPNATAGTYGIKVGDHLGATAVNFAPTTTAMMGLDYNSSSIGIDFGTTVKAVKQIKVIPDKTYRTHRIVERTLELYTSADNITYKIIPKTKWMFTKDDKGVITITLTERTAARYLKVHVNFDDRDIKFKARDKATFLNDFAKLLRVYQGATSRTEEFSYDADGNRILQRITLVQTNSYCYSSK